MTQLHIGIYHTHNSAIGEHLYRFFVGPKDSFRENIFFKTNLKLVKSIPVEEKHLTELKEFLARGRGNNLGHMWYAVLEEEGKKTATGKRLLPKQRLLPKDWDYEPTSKHAPGLGFILERECLLDLKQEHGVDTVNDGKDPFYGRIISEARQNALKKAGLKIHKDFPIDEWITGLEKGIKRSLRK